MLKTVTLVTATALVATGCMQKPKPRMTPGPRTAYAPNVRPGDFPPNACKPITGGLSCTDQNTNTWTCLSGQTCTRDDR